ncbi:MAG: hypothetical protein OSB19_16580 [Opitutaceae bacterium]|nr:hypothetical protein [Opitutaceae bacterium]
MNQNNQYMKRAMRISSTLDPGTDSHIKELHPTRTSRAGELSVLD